MYNDGVFIFAKENDLFFSGNPDYKVEDCFDYFVSCRDGDYKVIINIDPNYFGRGTIIHAWIDGENKRDFVGIYDVPVSVVLKYLFKGRRIKLFEQQPLSLKEI